MKKLLIIIMVSIFIVVGATALNKGNDTAIAAICFLKGERTSGFNKICYYDCISGTVAITIRNIELCPLTIND